MKKKKEYEFTKAKIMIVVHVFLKNLAHLYSCKFMHSPSRYFAEILCC